MNFSYKLDCGAIYRSQIRGYFDDLKKQLSAAQIVSDYTEIKSFLTSNFIFRAYNLSNPQYEAISKGFRRWEEKIKNYLSEDN